MDSPTNALIGVAGIFLGGIIIYGAYANVSVFGKQGLIGEAIATGQVPDVSTLPKLFASITGPSSAATDTGVRSLQDALASIKKTDPTLAGELNTELGQGSSLSKTGKPSPKLLALISDAKAKGFTAEAAAIEAYIKIVQGLFAANANGPASLPGGSVINV